MVCSRGFRDGDGDGSRGGVEMILLNIKVVLNDGGNFSGDKFMC